jgi:hypothetical protein
MKTSELIGAALDWAVHVALHKSCEGYAEHEYSTNWEYGGPIIEREEIFLAKSILGGWTGSMYVKDKDYNCIMHAAPTPLIAAMRCYVASKLGDTVDVPKELTK